MAKPSFAQIEYLDSLCLRAGLSRLQVGDVHTAADAGAAIDTLYSGRLSRRGADRRGSEILRGEPGASGRLCRRGLGAAHISQHIC
jgi:hypothetical protein